MFALNDTTLDSLFFVCFELISGFVLGVLHWSAVLCEGDGGCDSKGPESQRPCLVWSSSSSRLFVGLRHYVSTG